MAFLMKHIYAPDILPKIRQISSLLADLSNRNFLYFKAIFKYIITSGEASNKTKIIEVLKDVTPEEKKEEIMTIAEMLK